MVKINKEFKQELRGYLPDLLKDMGINTKKNFHCLNPDHDDRHPSMSYCSEGEFVKCFSCDAKYDIFDLVKIEYNVDDFMGQVAKVCELVGKPIPEAAVASEVDDFKATKSIQTNKKSVDAIKKQVDYSDYYKKVMSDVDKTLFFKNRGFTDDTISKFRCGFDVAKGIAVIPVTKHFYIGRSVNQKGFYNPKGAEVDLFNLPRIMGCTKEPVFIVESATDAMSIEQCGGSAIALNSVNNFDKFIECVQKYDDRLAGGIIILSMDNDNAGQKAAYGIRTALANSNIKVIENRVSGELKDANELLIENPEQLKANIDQAKYFAMHEEEILRDEYNAKSAAGYLEEFVKGIQERANASYIPTGFEELDKALDGGLYPGLYFIGALSSLGKTTYVLQLADQVAQQGYDVLIFSLEMAKRDLIAKSISRLTFETAQEAKKAYLRKTVRGVENGKFYANYSAEEVKHIQDAIHDYSTYAGNIFIIEGIGDVGVAHIREKVKEHINRRKKTPIVIIDYVQILMPAHERMTDKQAVDYNVLELKRISRDYNLPLIGISSINRMNYAEPITMSAFKESGSLEYSSDILFGLQFYGVKQSSKKKEKFDVDEAKGKDPREIQLVILKNRNGRVGVTLDYDFYAPNNCFKETEREGEEE